MLDPALSERTLKPEESLGSSGKRHTLTGAGLRLARLAKNPPAGKRDGGAQGEGAEAALEEPDDLSRR